MKVDTKIFRSKIARRIFILFVSCALFPILCISIISFARVTKQLNEQSYKLLKQSITGYASSILERMIFLDTELQLISSSIKESLIDPDQTRLEVVGTRSGNHFMAIAYMNPENKYVPIYKKIDNLKIPRKDDVGPIIGEGRTTIFKVSRPGSFPQTLMARLVDPEDLNTGYLIGEIKPAFLWGLEQGNSLPPNTEFCVLDESYNILYSSFLNGNPSFKKDDFQVKNRVSGQFELVHKNEKYLASYRKIFLNRRFLAGCWTVVACQSKADVLAPMSHFRTIFPLVLLLSLWVVLFLSIYNIRKSLVPLEILKEGTRQISMNRFDSKINLTSGDEFEEFHGF